MKDDELVVAELAAIHARLGTMEGKLHLISRAERPQLLPLLEDTVRSTPLIGQIYLLLDGTRNQIDVGEKLAEFGIVTSTATVSRYITKMETDHGIIIEIAQAGRGKVFIKDPAQDKVLNLTAHVRKWLRAEGEVVPEPPPKTRKKKKND